MPEPGHSRTSKRIAAETSRALAARRARMDSLNARLRDLLQERALLAVEIARWKSTRGLRVADPAREQAMLDRLLARPTPGFDRATLRRLLRTIFAASRRLAVREAKPRARRRRSPS
jgi:chorismate mutase